MKPKTAVEALARARLKHALMRNEDIAEERHHAGEKFYREIGVSEEETAAFKRWLAEEATDDVRKWMDAVQAADARRARDKARARQRGLSLMARAGNRRPKRPAVDDAIAQHMVATEVPE